MEPIAYKVLVYKVNQPDEKGYSRDEQIFEQKVDRLDIRKIIAAVNDFSLPQS